MLNQKNLSIVIPSLGGSKLESTLKYMYKMKIRPLEIIYVFQSHIKKILKFQKSKTKIILTKIKGQVYQRVAGFKKARGKYVLQLDDDIKIDNYCLNKLLNTIEKFKKISISPLLIDKKRKYSLFDIQPKNFFFKIYHFLLNGINGYEPGSVSKAGIPYMFKNKGKIKEGMATRWMFHRKKNLIKKNYFKFKSDKAFCEDLFHSFHLRNKKIKLLIDSSSKCSFNSFKGFKSLTYKSSINNLFQDFKIRFSFIRLTKKSVYRMMFFYFILFLRLNYIFIKKLKI